VLVSIYFPETSVRNYHCKLGNISEERWKREISQIDRICPNAIMYIYCIKLHVSTYFRSSSGSRLVFKTNWLRHIHYVSSQNSIKVIQSNITVEVISRNRKCGQRFYHNSRHYKCCLYILLSLLFWSCHIVSSPNVSTWNHSDFDYVIHIATEWKCCWQLRNNILSKIR
jgi:hypothetical protein